MVFRFGDSFDHYVTADLTEKWTASVVLGSGAANAISAGNGRNGTASYRSTSGNATTVGSGGRIQKTIDAQSVWVVGFSFRLNTTWPVSQYIIAELLDASSAQVDLRANADGTLSITRAGTTLGTTAFALSVDTTYYIEW